jgi:hypothetical protein
VRAPPTTLSPTSDSSVVVFGELAEKYQYAARFILE